jgi:hypothetical protein
LEKRKINSKLKDNYQIYNIYIYIKSTSFDRCDDLIRRVTTIERTANFFGFSVLDIASHRI